MTQPRFEPVFVHPSRETSANGNRPAPNGHPRPEDTGHSAAPTEPQQAQVAFVPPVVMPPTLPTRRAGHVDYTEVHNLRRVVSDRLTEWLRGRASVSEEEQAAERDRLARELVAAHVDAQRQSGTPLNAADEQALLNAVAADLAGLGRLQTMLDDATIEEIHVLGHDRVRITRRDGTIAWGEPIADSDAEMVETLQTLARRAGSTERSLSTLRPTLDLQLPEGSRLAATHLVSHRPIAVIRRHNTLDVSLDDVAGGRQDLAPMVDPVMRDLLRAAMRGGMNIMLAGVAGAGKTTLLRALAAEIPAEEPFVVLEESRELGLHNSARHPWAMSFEAREGHGERGPDGRPAGEVTIADLIPVSLRMGVQRIIVGEVRSREIVPMLQAMTTSRGSMCTIHARSPASVPERIIELALSYGREMTSELARRMTANALDLIVYVNLIDETGLADPSGRRGRKHRFVSHIEQVVGIADGGGGRIATTTIFGPGQDGRGIPLHLPEPQMQAELHRVGYDSRQLSSWIEAGRGAWPHPLPTLLRRAP